MNALPPALALDLSMLRPHFQFSLRAFFLTLLVASLGTSHLYTSWQLRRARLESSQLRHELGYLVVDERDYIHAIGVPTDESLKWQWRLYLPEEHRFQIHLASGSIPQIGYPPAHTGVMIVPIDGGQFTLTAAARRNHLGEWQLSIRHGSGGSSLRIPPAQAAWLLENAGWSVQEAGKTMTETAEPTIGLTLLRVRTTTKVAGGIHQITPQPCDGLMVWVEPVRSP